MNSVLSTPPQLAKGICRGSESIFREFYLSYKGYIYLKLFNLVKERQVADDLFQTVLVKIVRSKPKWKSEGELKSWVAMVVRSVVVDHFRKQNRILESTESLDTSTVEVSETDSGVDENGGYRRQLELAIARLELSEAEIVKAVYLEQIARREVAEKLGLSYKALESKLVRIRKKLRLLILEEIEDD